MGEQMNEWINIWLSEQRDEYIPVSNLNEWIAV